MITIDFETCYGCEACANICPQNAIRMVENNEGFKYPKVDEEKCVKCNLCEKVCPNNQTNIEKIKYPPSREVYAAWNKNVDDVLKSTSGGIFTVIAKQFVLDGGVVYGCAWHNEHELIAEHKRCTSLDDLDALRGSKYVKSRLLDTFKETRDDLKNGNKVLYSGTPCQIAALRLFLLRRFENLYTIDLVCHGTPSPKIFKAYLDFLEVKHKSPIRNFHFRDKKKFGWRAYTSYVACGSKIMTSIGLDFYLYGYYSNIMNRNSCYQCTFSCSNRVGDITLSDFWNGEKTHHELNKQRKYGYNMVMCNTEKGLLLFRAVFPWIEFIKSNLETAQAGDIRLREVKIKPIFRKIFYELLNKNGFDWMTRKILKPRFYFVKKYMPDFIENILRYLLIK